MTVRRCCLRRFELFFVLASINVCLGLRDVAIRVPEAVEIGDTVKLACDYDLEGAALYTIKWYWDDQEFYRFVPKESPAYKVFPLEGFNVDQDLSDASEVTLRSVQRDLTGFYKCEVSADAPYFHTEIKSAPMIVADLPDEDPILTTEKVKYSLGEKIRANCTASAAYPAANLTWFLNGQQVSTMASPHTKVSVTLIPAKDDLEGSRSALEVEATSSAFREGKLKLRCLAKIYTIYRRTEEVEILEDTPQLAPVMGPTAPHSHDSSTSSQSSSEMQLVVLCSLSTLLRVYNSR